MSEEEKSKSLLEKIRQKKLKREREDANLLEAKPQIVRSSGKGVRQVNYSDVKSEDMGYLIEYTPATYKEVIKDNGAKIVHNITILGRRRGITKDSQLATILQMKQSMLSRYRSGAMIITPAFVAAAAIGLDVDLRTIFDLSRDDLLEGDETSQKKAKVYSDDELWIIQIADRLKKVDERGRKLINYVLNFIEGN